MGDCRDPVADLVIRLLSERRYERSSAWNAAFQATMYRIRILAVRHGENMNFKLQSQIASFQVGLFLPFPAIFPSSTKVLWQDSSYCMILLPIYASDWIVVAAVLDEE